MSVTLAQIQSAVVEASERYTSQYGIPRTRDWVALKLSEEAGEVVQTYLRATGRSRHGAWPDDEARTALANEIADLIGMAVILAAEAGIDAERDLVPAIRRKWHTDLGVA